MPRHSFIRMFKLPDVQGRVDYITNPKRQEYLYAAYATVPQMFWKHLSEQSQFNFWRSNQSKGKCIEARELVIALPEALQKADPDLLLKLFTETFRTKYGMECAAALHHNKAKTNYHIHLVFSDRDLLEESIEKIATRNMFYDESGRHVRTKKQILGEDGKVRPGCRIIPKGSPYEIRYFSEHKDIFKSKSFLQEVKELYTGLINQCLRDEKDRLQIFDTSGPYLPTKKIGKNNPKEAEIRRDNELRREWNHTIDQVLVAGATQEELVDFKKKHVTEKVAESIRVNGKNPTIFATVLTQALSILKFFLHFLMFRQEQAEKKKAHAMKTVEEQQNLQNESHDVQQVPAEPPVESTTHAQIQMTQAERKQKGPAEVTVEPLMIAQSQIEQADRMQQMSVEPHEEPVTLAQIQMAQAELMRMEGIHNDLSALNRKIYTIGKTISNLERQLKAIPKGFFHRKARNELSSKIALEKSRLKNTQEQMCLLPKEFGFETVNDVETAYRAAVEKYDSLQQRHNEEQAARKERGKEVERKTASAENHGRNVAEERTVARNETVPSRQQAPIASRTPASAQKSTGQKRSMLSRLAEKQELINERERERGRASNRKERSNRGLEL